MTDHLPIIGDFDDDDSGARRRGFWGLAAIALVAATIVVILGFVLDHKSSPGSDKANPNLITNFSGGASPVPTPTSTLPATVTETEPDDSFAPPTSATAGSTSTTSTSASKSATPTPTKPTTSTPPPTHTHSNPPPPFGPCPSAAPCVLPNDYGAIEAIRARAARNATGTVSPAAQSWALGRGNGNCDSDLCVYEHASDRATALNTAISDAASSLSKTGSFEIGWAYDPSTSQYLFAILVTG